MKVDFNFTPVDMMTGEPMTLNEKPATLATISVQALMATTQEDANMSGEDKVSAYVLASRIIKGGIVDVSVEEASLLKKRIAKLYGVMVVGQCLPVLDRDATHLALVADAAKEVANG